MSRRPALRGLIGLAVSMVLALGGVAALAGAAEAGKPTKPPKSKISVTAEVEGTDADITVVVAYKSGDVEFPECAVDGDWVSCGEPISGSKNSTTYSIPVSNLPSGEHEFVITLTLVRKGTTVSGSTTFATVGEPVDLETLCVQRGGTYSANGPLANLCLRQYASQAEAEADMDSFFAALRSACRGDAYLGGGLNSTALIDFNCATEAHLQLLTICPEEATSNSGVDVVSCQTTDSSIAEPFQAVCDAAGGFYIFQDEFDPDVYICLAAPEDPVKVG